MCAFMYMYIIQQNGVRNITRDELREIQFISRIFVSCRNIFKKNFFIQ